MGKLAIKLVMKNYDHIQPLACGDVKVAEVDLELDRKSSMHRILDDPSYQAGEMSFSQYLIRRSQGETEYVGLPVFPTRQFRHRCFLVRRESGMSSLKDLAGKRIGTNGWPDTGNTWSRAALREAGVSIDSIAWHVGPIEDLAYDSLGHRPKLNLPENVQMTPPGQSLVSMLLAGDLDALMIPVLPASFYESDAPIVRLIPDYVTAEKEYLARVGYFPAHHIIVVRRDVFERDPWVARALFTAFDTSKKSWEEERRGLNDTSPWLQHDIEEATRLLGWDWQPYGVEPNREMITALCEEELAQKLVDRPIDPNSPFAEYEQATNA